MDSMSVISLSSSSSRSSHGPPNESRLGNSDNTSIISLGSESEFQRVPVSWSNSGTGTTKRRSKSAIPDLETPQQSEKVRQWMACKCGDPREHSPIPIEIYDSDENMEETNRENMVCIRYDFEKNNGDKQKEDSPFVNTGSSLYTYLKEARKSELTRQQSQSRRDARTKSVDRDRLRNNGSNVEAQCHDSGSPNNKRGTNNRRAHDTPLSPESQKKEFCSYLQLMKPTDRKQRIMLENRRSMRVKNLNTVMEKKKKSEEGAQNTQKDCEEDLTSDVNVVNYPTLKSFEDLTIQMKSLESILKSKKMKLLHNSPNKYLPLPPIHFYRDQVDFEDSLKEIIDEVNEVRVKVNGCIKKVEGSRKKFRFIRSEEVRLLGNTQNSGKLDWKRTNSLRSKGRLKNFSVEEVMLRKSRLREKSRRKYQMRKSNQTKERQRARELTGGSTPENEDIIVLTNTKERIGTEKDVINKSLGKGIHTNPINTKEKRDREKTVARADVHEKENSTSTNNSREKSAGIKVVAKINEEVPEKVYVSKTRVIATITRKKSVDDTAEVMSNQGSRCEILTIPSNSDDENVDLRYFVDDMLELDKLSEEHKKSVILSRILSSGGSLSNLINQNKSSSAEDFQKACKIFSDVSNESHYKSILSPVEDDESEKVVLNESLDKENRNSGSETSDGSPVLSNLIVSEHNYVTWDEMLNEGEGDQELTEEEVEAEEEVEEEAADEPNSSPVVERISPVPIQEPVKVVPINKNVEMKSLHRSLTLPKRKMFANTVVPLHHGWDTDNGSNNKKLSHSISISRKNGSVLRAFYIDNHIIVCQQFAVCLWTQSALGNILGAQNMWIPNGHTERLVLNNKYLQKESMGMVISTEASVAYVELWTKEHKSDFRERPLADVFATVYFWRYRQGGLDKKALQLENIKGSSNDVQYVVLTNVPKIVVSWHSQIGDEKKTQIHSYLLASDFQTVSNISEIAEVSHYISSLHNIEDCENLVMGCGENRITLWNVEYGYVVATIDLSSITSSLSTFWAKCDRGFLFTVQECVEKELRLVAINGMNQSWKKLQNYKPPNGFDGLRGVYIESGLLIAFYRQGIMCWNAQTGEPVMEEIPTETEYLPSGKHVIMIVNEQIIVKHALSHFITADDF